MVMRQGPHRRDSRSPRRQSGRPHEAGRPLTKRRLSNEAGIFLVLVGIALLFEAVGWSVRGASFLFSGQRLLVMVLQVSIIGLLAIGVTQVILTGGIDLSSGSVVALSAMIAASLAQTPSARAVFPLADRSARLRPGGRRPGDRCAGRPRQRQPDRLHRDPAVHRHARHDGERARSRALLHQRPAGQHADARTTRASAKARCPSSSSW